MESDRYHLLETPCDVVGRCVEYLSPEDLIQFEGVSRATRRYVADKKVWKRVFQRIEELIPVNEPSDWKSYLLQCRRERRVQCAIPIEDTHAVIFWRVKIPAASTEELQKVKSREFIFSKDALGRNITWQCCLTTDDSNSELSTREKARMATLRIWTTDTWTPESVQHYYGSYCTGCVRDALNENNLNREQYFDIDTSAGFNFSVPRTVSEVVLKINLTLLLSQDKDPSSLYNSFSSREYSTITKIGLAQALSELTLYRRREWSGKLRSREVGGIRKLIQNIREIAFSGESKILCAELLQVVAHTLGPTTINNYIVAEVSHLADVCQYEADYMLANQYDDEDQRLAHGMLLCLYAISGFPIQYIQPLVNSCLLESLVQLANTPGYNHVRFPVIVVVLSVGLKADYYPITVVNSLTRLMARFMESTDPTDHDTSGIVWDEYDISRYFLPLLMSGDLLTVSFSSWCIGRYYFF